MTQNQTSVCALVKGKGKGMFINQEQLHSTCCVLEPNTPAPESFTGCKARVIFCDIKFKARMRSGCCATCLLDDNLKTAH